MSPTRPAPSRGIRLFGLAAVALLAVLVARFWHPVYGFTAFLQLDESNAQSEIAAWRGLPVYVYHNTGPYDGLYYAQLAYHPLLRDPELAQAIDNIPYRGRRILPSALAWLAAGGRPAWIVHAYSVLNLVAWLALALLLWRGLPVTDARSALAWAAVLFSAGALASVRLALTDLIAATLVVAALRAAEQQRPGWSLGSLAAAGLARETALLALPGLWTRPWLSRPNFWRSAAVAAPLLAWLAYIRWQVGSSDPGIGNFTVPFAGWVEKWRACLAAVRHLPPDGVLAWGTLLATAGLTLQAIYLIARPNWSEAWWRLGAAYVLLFACLGTPVWEDNPGAVQRVLLPLTIAFNVLVVRRRAALIWLLAGNLAVGAGLLAFRDAPFDDHELAAARWGGAACIAREGSGWYGAEHTWRHRWAWSPGLATVTFESWPRATQTLDLTFAVRSLNAREVTLRQGERELWRGWVGGGKLAGHAEITVTAGQAAVTFASPAPGVQEAASLGGRTLAFALYDLTVSPHHAAAAAPGP